MRTLSLLTLAVLAGVCAFAQAPRRSSSTQDIEAKVALESSVERRLQEVLRKLLDSEDVVVVVNADLLTDVERGDTEILPGVAVKETPAEAAPLELPASLVRRMAVTIFLDQRETDAQVELARTTAARMVGLKTERGDSVAVQKLDFPKKVLTPAEQFREQFLNPRGFLSLSWLLVACMALVLLSRRFFDPFVSALKDTARGLAEKSSSGRAAEVPAEARETAAAAAAEAAPRPESGAEPPRRIPFSFIRDRDLPTLNMLLHEQPAQTVAAIVHYLPPAIASATLAAMSPERRDEVVAQMTSPVLLNPSDVKALEDSIRSRIDYMIGGEEKLAEILDQSPVRLQSEILSSLRFTDEALWDRLQRRVVVLEDLALLDEAGLAALSRAVPLKSMAVALKANPALAGQVVGKLKTGLGEWLRQEIDLSAKVPEGVEQAETRKVVNALARLVREGRLILRKEHAPPVLPPSAPDAGPADAPLPQIFGEEPALPPGPSANP